MASPFVGGPERQMLGLAASLPSEYRSVFLSFSEQGQCRPLLTEARRLGLEAVELEQNFPHVLRSAREIAGHLRRLGAELICASGYKPDIVGSMAARMAGVPLISIAHGWTGATWRVRLYEKVDRRVMRRADRTVCVSARQAERARSAGVPSERVVVIHNAIEVDRAHEASPRYRDRLQSLFPRTPELIVGAAGRLSPEKGFCHFVDAAEIVARTHPRVGFVLFGEGPLRDDIAEQIRARGLSQQFVLPGFRSDLAEFLPHLDLLVLPSLTEGLPVIVLEAFAAGVPVVATAVGGTPEVVVDGRCGYLVRASSADALAARICDLVARPAMRAEMGAYAREHVAAHFSRRQQSLAYQAVFDEVLGGVKSPAVEQHGEMVLS